MLTAQFGLFPRIFFMSFNHIMLISFPGFCTNINFLESHMVHSSDDRCRSNDHIVTVKYQEFELTNLSASRPLNLLS